STYGAIFFSSAWSRFLSSSERTVGSSGGAAASGAPVAGFASLLVSTIAACGLGAAVLDDGPCCAPPPQAMPASARAEAIRANLMVEPSPKKLRPSLFYDDARVCPHTPCPPRLWSSPTGETDGELQPVRRAASSAAHARRASVPGGRRPSAVGDR